MRRGGLGNRQVAHTGLNHGGARDGVDVLDAVELGQRERHAHGVGHGAARQARARAPRHHWNIQVVTGFEHRRDLCLGLGQGHGQWALAVSGQAIALVRHGVFAVPQQGVGGQDRLQGLHHRGEAARAFFGGKFGAGGVHANQFRPKPSAWFEETCKLA